MNTEQATVISTIERMVEEFQCAGCVNGSSPQTCSRFDLNQQYGSYCINHVLGTSVNFAICFALGLPKGFNRPAPDFHDGRPATRSSATLEIRLWLRGEAPTWDRFNIAVWAMEREGYLFVRTVSPRTSRSFTDVIEGGTVDLTPGAINVGDFYDEID